MTKVTLGGQRLGSGKKNEVYLHNYQRSTHNLNRKFASTMGVGMLIPFYTKIATRGDKFEIDLSAGLRTIPTKGPLFGSFKLQVDMFQCPLRLYQALLHNNPLAIGLKTQQIKWPKIRLYAENDTPGQSKIAPAANNSLVRYLDIAGLGTLEADTEVTDYSRDFFGAGVLAYYDIFKNYYANKQEENAYTCTTAPVKQFDTQYQIKYHTNLDVTSNDDEWDCDVTSLDEDFCNLTIVTDKKLQKEEFEENTIDIVYQRDGEEDKEITGIKIKKALELGYIRHISYGVNEPNEIQIIWNTWHLFEQETWYFTSLSINKTIDAYANEVVLQDFPLKNIDDMRMDILSFHTLGRSYVLDGHNSENMGSKSPYIDAIGEDYHDTQGKKYAWQKPLSGICVKTYQSDLFNNWINTEWIDGENGIAEITAVATTEGSIKIDALNFAEKLYNLLNRVAASDGTYEGYLDVAYTESDKRFCESPMWIGGMSDEIVFEEIVQTAPAEGSELGTLGGRGNLLGKEKGGKITVKVDEPSIIMGIVSITPRIMYTQGNEWHNTELNNLADLHVPALDGIAFQNLMAEQMHYGATLVAVNGDLTRPIVGKVPAWINYMTDFDRAYGDFAATGGDGYMILNRNYLVEDGELQDATTYIDPAKFNYAFAYTKRDAQNFWVAINAKVTARRLMSAKQIPSI